jgi:hypothetical protein
MVRASTADELSKNPFWVFRYMSVLSMIRTPVGLVITLVTTRTRRKLIKTAAMMRFQGPSFIVLSQVFKSRTTVEMVDLKRMAQRMKLHKIEGTVVHHCALLVKFLAEEGVASKVIHGYCVSPNEICEHYWVRVEPEGLDMDIGYELACMYSPELMALKTVLTEEFPVGLKDRNGKEPEVLRHEDNQRLFELYETQPKAFWNESPKNVRTFRPT